MKLLSFTPKDVVGLCARLERALKALDGVLVTRDPSRHQNNDITPILRSIDPSIRAAVGKKLFIDQIQRPDLNLLRDDPKFWRLLKMSPYEKKLLEPLYDFYGVKSRAEALVDPESFKQPRLRTFTPSIPPSPISSLQHRIESYLSFPASKKALLEDPPKTDSLSLEQALEESSVLLVLRTINKTVSNVESLRLKNEIDSLLPSPRKLRLPDPSINLQIADELKCVVALYSSLKADGLFLDFMFLEFSTKIDDSIGKLVPALARPDLVDFKNNGTEQDELRMANCLTILKSLMHHHYILTVDLSKNDAVDKLPELFRILNEARSRGDFEVCFGQINYLNTPFLEQIIDAVRAEASIAAAKNSYEALLGSAKVGRLEQKNTFVAMLLELAKHGLDSVSKPPNKDCLYVTSSGYKKTSQTGLRSRVSVDT